MEDSLLSEAASRRRRDGLDMTAVLSKKRPATREQKSQHEGSEANKCETLIGC